MIFLIKRSSATPFSMASSRVHPQVAPQHPLGLLRRRQRRRLRRRLGTCHRRPHPVAGAGEDAAAQGLVHRRQALLGLLPARATGSYT